MSRVKFFFQISRNRLSSEDFVCKPVDEVAKGFCDYLRLFVASREVNLASVDSMVSVETAEARNPFETRRRWQTVDFLSEGCSLASSKFSHVFQARTEQGAGRARREFADGLCLKEKFCRARWHIGGRLNAASDWINNFVIDFKLNTSAVCALPNSTLRSLGDCVGINSFVEDAVGLAL